METRTISGEFEISESIELTVAIDEVPENPRTYLEPFGLIYCINGNYKKFENSNLPDYSDFKRRVLNNYEDYCILVVLEVNDNMLIPIEYDKSSNYGNLPAFYLFISYLEAIEKYGITDKKLLLKSLMVEIDMLNSYLSCEVYCAKIQSVSTLIIDGYKYINKTVLNSMFNCYDASEIIDFIDDIKIDTFISDLPIIEEIKKLYSKA